MTAVLERPEDELAEDGFCADGSAVPQNDGEVGGPFEGAEATPGGFDRLNHPDEALDSPDGGFDTDASRGQPEFIRDAEAKEGVGERSEEHGLNHPDDAQPAESVGRRIVSWLLTGLMVVSLLLASAVVVVPRLIGAVPLTVLTGSMRPVIQPGDLIVSRRVDPNTLQIGQVVTFQPVSGDPTLITHRIIDITRNLQGETVGLVTRGDANGVDDAPLVPEQVMGRLVYRIPRVGFLTNNTGSALQLGMFLGVGLIAYAVVILIRPEKKTDDNVDSDDSGVSTGASAGIEGLNDV